MCVREISIIFTHIFMTNAITTNNIHECNMIKNAVVAYCLLAGNTQATIHIGTIPTISPIRNTASIKTIGNISAITQKNAPSIHPNAHISGLGRYSHSQLNSHGIVYQ